MVFNCTCIPVCLCLTVPVSIQALSGDNSHYGKFSHRQVRKEKALLVFHMLVFLSNAGDRTDSAQGQRTPAWKSGDTAELGY